MNSNQKKYGIVENYSMLFIDGFSIAVSYLLAYIIRSQRPKNFLEIPVVWAGLVFSFLAGIAFYLLTNGGNKFFSRGPFAELIEVIKHTVFIIMCTGFLVYAVRVEGGFSRMMLFYYGGFNFFLTYFGRLFIKSVTLRAFRQGKKGDKVLLITTSDKVESVLEHIESDTNWSYKVGSIAITDKNMMGQSVKGIPVMADKDNLLEALRALVMDVVFVYYPELSADAMNDLVEAVQLTGAMCHCSIDLPAKTLFKVGNGKFAGFPVVTYSVTDYDYRKRLIKRFVDIIGSIIGLILTAVIFPFVALAIKIDSPGPVLFSQVRLSKNGRQFKIYKFRTMYQDAEERKKELMEQNQMQGNMFKMDNDPRITKVGAFLRKTSIDELPQFWNIFTSDMSLVGTRPPTMDEFEKYTEYQKRRLSIRPGLTGMWQVSGRSEITDFDEIVRLDLEYIDNWSLGLDFKILIKTFLVVFARKGAE